MWFLSDLVNIKNLLDNFSVTARYEFSSMGVNSLYFYTGQRRKEILSDIKYNEFGQMTEITRGNNTVTDYVYDIKGRLVDDLTSDLGSLASENITWNAAKQPAGIYLFKLNTGGQEIVRRGLLVK